MKVGFIGLGAMGLPMAKNVLAGGHSLCTMVHRRKEPGEELKAAGATLVSSPAEVAHESDVIITIVPGDAELLDVVLGERGVRDGLAAGKTLIEMTSSMGLTMEKVAAELDGLGIEMIDAPVSGGTPKAASGELTIIAGAEKATLEKYRSLLECMGSVIHHVGPVGSGKVVKMVNQLMAAVHLLTIGEAFALGKHSGADPEAMLKVIRDSSGYSRMMDLRLPGFLLDGSFDPGFKLDLMKKDVNLAVESAKEMNIPLMLGGLASNVFSAASNAGFGEDDFSRAAYYLGGLSGCDLGENQ